jgi:putative nucleotidyltransferase with HDIG domain
MIKEPHLTLFDLAICLSDACDLISPALTNHHKQVAYISYSIGKELGLDDQRLTDVTIAAAMHDIGALSLRERIDLMEFESTNTSAHCEVGYYLLRSFKPTERIADIVRRHHHYWNDANRDATFLIESDIIHCADRVALLIDRRKDVIGQVDDIREKVAKQRSVMFNPEVHDAFAAISEKEYFWLDTISPTVYRILRRSTRTNSLTLHPEQLHDLAMLFSRIIDFRSHFTATHSAGVAATAAKLAELSGFSKRECEYMHIAGLLHDLGKLAIPREVLEKPGKLDKAEFDLIRTHTYHTYRILDTLEDFETINEWGAFHHERLNGKGYPFHHQKEDLSLGSRIMAVADIFSAIIEDRPYRKGMDPEEVTNLLNSIAAHRFIDQEIVSLLKRNQSAVNEVRIKAQSESKRLYDEMFSQ